nr:STAS domain-containing protein [Mycobacterium sp. E796]
MDGVLDSSTYRTVRDTVIKAALDEPRAVIVDVNRLSAPSASAWTVFTSARWHVSVWPDVPILLVCEQPRVRRSIAAGGVTRYVPVHPTRMSALDAVHGQPLAVRRRARSELPADGQSVGLARAVITDWLTQWDKPDLIPVAATVGTVFVENVLDHTESAPVLIVESHRDTVTVAVEDCSDRLPGRHEDGDRGAEIVSGLAIVSALCRSWGATPTSSGKTVWALVGRENLL